MTKLPQDLEDKLATVPEDFHAPLRSWVMGAYLAGLRDGSRQQASEPAERTERETIIASLTFIQRKVLHHLESLTAGGTVPTTQSHLARACGYPSAPYIRSPLVRLHALGLVLDMAPPGSGRPDLRPVLGAPVAPPPPVRKPAPAALAAPLAASGPALVPEPAREARRPLPARPAAPGPAQNVTAALLGADGNGGRRPAGVVEGIRVSTYLIRRGFSCTPAWGGWMVNGKFMDKYDVLDIVNAKRKGAGLEPATISELE